VPTSSSSCSSYFPFEQTDVYRLAKSVNERISTMRWPSGRSHVRDQCLRASDSACLNLAGGWGRARGSKASKNHFRIACGSAGEAFACLDLVDADDTLKNDTRRLGSMLFVLGR